VYMMSEKMRVSRLEARSTDISSETIIALHETDGVGPLTIDKLIRYCNANRKGVLRYADQLQVGDWREMGIHAKQATSIVKSLRPEAMNLRAQKHLDRGMSVITYLDEEYPELLAHISDPPWVLYYKGNIKLFQLPAISIVGTRIATSYGRKVAEDIAAGCAKRMTVVSGLARGIDTAAHIGALRMPCSTIAVLAGAVDQCYPPENKALYREIVDKGLLISESQPDLPLAPGLFPLRNRIIAGLSRGVIVVEAAERSGALITADLAFDYSRDVFIIPGPLSSPKSRGALNYIRKGGSIILDETDIFQVYSSVLPEIHEPIAMGNEQHSSFKLRINLTPDEQIIYDILLEKACSIDELMIESGMTFGLLHSILISLLIKYNKTL
jgi:DNA processing protein